MKKLMMAAAVAALISPMGIYARQLTPAQALEAASMSISGIGHSAPAANRLVYTATQEGLNTLYVFAGAERGFTILSADDVCIPVLAICDDGIFNPDNIPANMASWLAGYSAQISYAALHGGSVMSAPADPDLTDIAPMTVTLWNQDAPYNDLSPRVGSKATYTGCVATAVAQVMYTYKWPEHGTGTHSYTWNNQTLSFDYENTSFDWDNMLLTYRGVDATAEQKNAIATLMYGVGVSCNMNFGTGGSGSTGLNAAVGLAEYLDYDASLRFLSRDFYPLPEWCRMLHNEMSQGYPVYYDGANNTVGHAFVIDGYRASDGLFHVNWGWGGISNGYFAITTLDPDNQGIGGSTAGYGQGQSAIFNLRPQAGGETYVNICCNGEFAPYSGSYERDEAVIFIAGGAYSYSIGTLEIEFGLSLTDADGNVTYVWTPYKDTLPPYYGYSSVAAYVEDFPTEGTYTARPVVRTDNGEVYPVHTLVGTPSAATVVCTEDDITINAIENPAELGVENTELLSPFFRSKLALVETTVTNSGSEYYGTLTMKIKGMNGWTKVADVLVDILEGGSEKVTFNGVLPFAVKNGDTQIAFFDENNHQIGEAITVTVSAAPSGTAAIEYGAITLEGISGLGTAESPKVLNPAEFSATVQLTATAGYFTDYLYGCIFAPDGSLLGYHRGQLRPVAAGNTVAVPFNEDLTSYGLNPDDIYRFAPATLSENHLMVDLEKVAYFQTAGNSGITAAGTPNVGLYPNPASDFTTLTAATEVSSYEICAMDGRVMQSNTCATNDGIVAVEVSALPAGMYILRAVLADGNMMTERFIKK